MGGSNPCEETSLGAKGQASRLSGPLPNVSRFPIHYDRIPKSLGASSLFWKWQTKAMVASGTKATTDTTLERLHVEFIQVDWHILQLHQKYSSESYGFPQKALRHWAYLLGVALQGPNIRGRRVRPPRHQKSFEGKFKFSRTQQ